MKPSDPLMLANGTLLCRMYLNSKVAISQHLVTPCSPGVTILSASSVRTLVHCVVKYRRPRNRPQLGSLIMKSHHYLDFEACYVKFASVETVSIYQTNTDSSTSE